MAAALPLRTISRLWGKFNNMEIPEFLRPAGFKLYSFIFGCNLEEMKVQDLKAYPNLGSFFCRELKEGVRPIENEILVRISLLYIYIFVHECYFYMINLYKTHMQCNKIDIYTSLLFFPRFHLLMDKFFISELSKNEK